MRKTVRHHTLSILEPRSPRPRRVHTAALLGGTLVAIIGIAAFAQSQSKSGPTGKAQVVERRGPELPIAANGGGQVVVLFPQAAHNAGGQPADDVEVVFVESNVPAAQEGQPAPAAQSTGREIVFSTRDANEGVVRYSFDPAGGARKVMVLARVGGKYVEARQSGGGEGVMVFTVQKPEQPQDQQQQPQANAGQQGAQQSGQQGGQPSGSGGEGQQSNTGGGGAASGGGQGGQGQGGQQPAATPAQPPLPSQAAVILVYTGGNARQ